MRPKSRVNTNKHLLRAEGTSCTMQSPLRGLLLIACTYCTIKCMVKGVWPTAIFATPATPKSPVPASMYDVSPGASFMRPEHDRRVVTPPQSALECFRVGDSVPCKFWGASESGVSSIGHGGIFPHTRTGVNTRATQAVCWAKNVQVGPAENERELRNAQASPP